MLYKPFEPLDFNDRTCYLTGSSDTQQVNVFPGWILTNFGLSKKPFKLLDESVVTYADIRVPVSAKGLQAMSALETKVESAFLSGFDAVADLSEETLFQWMAKLLYGILHFEVRAGIRQQARIGERMTFSHSLLHRFSNFHYMLQSLVQPTVFEGSAPWSIRVFRVANAPETFSYRDEINTLTFSLRMKDFGIIACLQDNGCNNRYHEGSLSNVEGLKMHPIQFEEICAKYFYSSYLFNRLPEYSVIETPDANYIEPMTLRGLETKPLFDAWQNKIYGQVLENFWRPWGFLLLEIIKDPERPMSFIENENGDPIDPSAIGLTAG